MKPDQAQTLVKNTLEKSFDEKGFVKLAKNLLKSYSDGEQDTFEYWGTYIWNDFADYVSSYKRIGKYESPDKKSIDVLIVNLTRETSLDRARTMQRNFVAKYLNGGRGNKLKDAALVAFVAPNRLDWRFSFVKMEYKIDKKARVREEFTPARRYSFLVGENERSHTAQSCLLPILVDDKESPTLENLERAFSVEPIAKEFFEKYRELYLQLQESLDGIIQDNRDVNNDFEAKGIQTIDFAKKLLGQIVFLYFLQKKGWFGVKRGAEWGSGSKFFLRELFDQKHGSYKNFFNDILEPLFYEALRLERPRDYYSRFNCQIPFLNGGLFDPLGDYDWVNADILLPNDIFSNSNKTEEGDVGDGILDIFDRYNFTVKEDEPLEKEVAIDPEMLGKVFENLLAVKDRKSKGTYYTPREIVHYMCQESLINYLITELKGKVNDKDIRTLIKHGETTVEHDAQVVNTGRETPTYQFRLSEDVRKHANLMDEKLASILICDPAVGSGAFPVGIMNEIVKARTALTLHSNPESRIPNPESRIPNPESRIPNPESRTTSYHFKRHAIQNCLYGVDIDPGAIEIAKLRLWLSLIVDEEDRKAIQPLPNLDYKIVQGNSLLSVARDVFNSQLFDKLEELKLLYFNETSTSKKQGYQKQINEHIDSLTNGQKDFDFEIYFSEVFREDTRMGFDVVIANPPYIKEYIDRSAFDGLRNLPCYQGKMDLWYLFACKGIDVAKKDTGLIVFIAQNNWVTSYGASKMRSKIIANTKILNLIDFGDLKVFKNAGIQTMIIVLQNNLASDNYTFDYRKLHGKNPAFNNAIELLNNKENSHTEYLTPRIVRNKFENKILTFYDSEAESILNKISMASNLSLSKKEVANGIHHHHDRINKERKKILDDRYEVGDGIFVISNEEKNKIPFTKKELLIIKPHYTTKELIRWYGNSINKKWVIYTDSSFKNISKMKDYPNIKNHLDQFQEVITSANKPYGLHSARKELLFKGTKIISVRKCKRPTFTYVDFDSYVPAMFYVIKTDRVDLKYLTAILNSKLIAFWLKNNGKMQGMNFQIDKEPILALPILKTSSTNQTKIVKIVTKIIDTISSAHDLNNISEMTKIYNYEKQIDELIYKLYGLNQKEIGIIENHQGI